MVMTADQAHDIACLAFGRDTRIRDLLTRYGDALYSSLLPPGPDTGGQWVELVLLGRGEAKYLDDPSGQAVVVAECLINPVSGKSEVLVEETAEDDSQETE
jgi:hypothetical protein